MKTIKVSIVVPVYNVEEYIEKCVDSIIAQTLHDIEIILVNDGSTDGTSKIIEEIAKKDDRIIIINQQNQGAGAARNLGIKHANGKYIGFVDSDDFIYPQMYEKMYVKAEETASDMVIMGEIETTHGDNIKFPHKNSAIKKEEVELAYFNAIEYPEILQNVFLWNRLFLKEYWDKNNFRIPEGRKNAEDLLICTQTAVLAKKIAYVDGPFYCYRNYREDSLSFNLAREEKKLDYILAVSETKKFLKSTCKYNYFDKDFLIFITSIFILLQENMKSRQLRKKFFCNFADELDKHDFQILEKTWLMVEYPYIMTKIKKYIR